MSKPKGQKKTKLHTHSHVEATLLERQAAQWQERIISANSWKCMRGVQCSVGKNVNALNVLVKHC